MCYILRKGSVIFRVGGLHCYVYLMMILVLVKTFKFYDSWDLYMILT